MFLDINSIIKRDAEFPEMLDFRVTASVEDEKEPAAFLEGVITHRCLDEITFDEFESRSGHAGEAMALLEDEKQKIAKVIKTTEEDIDYFETIVLFETVQVQEAFRGHQIALRLMREIAFLCQNNHALYLLKAHPIGSDLEVTDDKCRELAAYYCSDPALAFYQVDPKTRALTMLRCYAAIVTD